MRNDQVLDLEVLVRQPAPDAGIDRSDPQHPVWRLGSRKVSIERVDGQKFEMRVRGWDDDELVRDTRGLLTFPEVVDQIEAVLTT